MDYATSDGTARAGTDYGAVSGTLTFDSNHEHQTFTIAIPLFDDSPVEDDETFFLTLSDAIGGVSLGDGGTALVTILDDAATTPPDTTPPVITGAPDRPADVEGWYDAPVTVTFTATDDQSGVASVTGPVTLSGEGANQSVTGTATDAAGNSAGTTVAGINIDLTKPVTTASVAGGDDSATGDHTVTLNASDNLSGISQTFDEIDGGNPQPYRGPFDIDGGATHTVAFWSVDEAGNTEDAQSVVVAGGTGENGATGASGGTGGTGTAGGNGVAVTQPTRTITEVPFPPTIVSLKRYGVHLQPTILVLSSATRSIRSAPRTSRTSRSWHRTGSRSGSRPRCTIRRRTR